MATELSAVSRRERAGGAGGSVKECRRAGVEGQRGPRERWTGRRWTVEGAMHLWLPELPESCEPAWHGQLHLPRTIRPELLTDTRV